MKKYTRTKTISVILCLIFFSTWKIWSARSTVHQKVNYPTVINGDPSQVVSQELGLIELTPTFERAGGLSKLLQLRTNQTFRVSGQIANPENCKPGEGLVLIEFYRHDKLTGDVICNSGGTILKIDPNDSSKVTFECESPAPRDVGQCEFRVRCGSDQYILRGRANITN